MKLKKVNIYFGSLLVLFIGMSLTVSTLHSHNHIEWYHPQKHVDTGTCLSVDSTECPICGYLFNADITRPSVTNVPLPDLGNVTSFALPSFAEPDLFYNRGRSPPVLV